MRHIKLYNKIANEGLKLFPDHLFKYDEQMDQEDGILVRSANLHDIELHANLKAIARAGAGTNNIPIEECSKKGIVVFNTPGANANAVKELVLSSMFLSARPSVAAIQWINGVKQTQGIAELVEQEKKNFVGCELANKTLGVIGLGAIGVKVANTALQLDMNVIGFDPFMSLQNAWQLSKDVQYTKSIDTIFRNCDFISIHVPLSKETKHIIDIVALAKMKSDACVLNFSRAGLVDDDAMVLALQEGKIKHYVTDFPTEKVLHQKKCICLPHLGASTPESEEKCAIMAVKQMKDYLENGNIVNSINLPNITLERGTNTRITCFHKNIKNMLAQISNIISNGGLNIENMINKSQGEYAYTMVDVDHKNIENVLNELNNLDAILKVNVYN